MFSGFGCIRRFLNLEQDLERNPTCTSFGHFEEERSASWRDFSDSERSRRDNYTAKPPSSILSISSLFVVSVFQTSCLSTTTTVISFRPRVLNDKYSLELIFYSKPKPELPNPFQLDDFFIPNRNRNYRNRTRFSSTTFLFQTETGSTEPVSARRRLIPKPEPNPFQLIPNRNRNYRNRNYRRRRLRVPQHASYQRREDGAMVRSQLPWGMVVGIYFHCLTISDIDIRLHRHTTIENKQ